MAAFALYSVTDAALKHLAGTYHPFQLSFFNALFAFVPYLAFAARGGWSSLRTTRPGLHVLRGVLAVATSACTFAAIGALRPVDIRGMSGVSALASLWFKAG